MQAALSILIVLGFIAAQTASQTPRVVCYYGEWSIYRPDKGHFSTTDIPAHLCTHIIYSFIGIRNLTNEVKILDYEMSMNKDGFKNFTSLRAAHPEVKFNVAIGGWNEGGHKFSIMASTNASRLNFTRSVVDFLQEHEFDGLDLVWDYPGLPERRGSSEDKDNYLSLVQELKAAFNAAKKGWELTAAIPISEEKLKRGYHVPELCKTLDAVHALTYDLRGNWDGFVDVHSPVFSRPNDLEDFKNINVNSGLNILRKNGCPANKIVVSVPFFGRSFTLPNKDFSYELGSKANVTAHGGLPGPFTRTRGFKAYYEICSEVDKPKSDWTKKWSRYGLCPYAYKGDQWIGYEDKVSVEIKMKYIKKRGYLGAANWAVDMDDFRGLCGEKYPLLNILHGQLSNYSVPVLGKTDGPVDYPDISNYPDYSDDKN